MLDLPGYSVGERIHESERTWVFRARKDDGTPVVLKTNAASFPEAPDLRKLRREFEIGRGLADEHVVAYLGLVPHEHRLVVVEEDFGATGLNRLIPAGGFAPDDFLDVAVQLAAALAAVHRGNVIHKDVKPANAVMNAATGTVKLVDFGIASRLRREDRQAVGLERLEGSLPYVAPEQTGRMQRFVDYRVDFYALGVTYYELLTGQLPFDFEDPLEIVHAHLARRPRPPGELAGGIPPVLSDIVLKLLAKDPEDRYQSAFGLIHDLRCCGGGEAVLELGTRDHGERFQIPQRLYGRRDEVSRLNAALERAVNAPASNAEVLLVAGYSGVGKSALARELHRPLTTRRGVFATGKFDLGRHNVPYSAIAGALDEVCRVLLAERASVLEGWRWRLLEAVGSNGRLLTEIVPSLVHVLGEQPELSTTGPREARDRLHRTFFRFLTALARPDHPLVLFLDDLQWADPASLGLLRYLLTAGPLPSFLLIGAYRDNEVDASHRLMRFLGEVEEVRGPLPRVALGNLDRDAVRRLVADCLRGSDGVEGLVELVYAKTRGNAFFTTELLKSLQRDGAIRFQQDAGAGGWTWDAERIRTLNVSDNVVAWMTAEMGELPPETLRSLKLAACLGSRFELGTLAQVCGEAGRRPVLETLWPAVEEGLLLCLDSTAQVDAAGEHSSDGNVELRFKFAHDRVRQAAYSLVPEGERGGVHLDIGRRLQAELPHDDGLLFEVVNHLNRAHGRIDDADERLELASLNLRAGHRAKAAAAASVAVDYLRAGVALLPDDAWSERYALAFQLHKELAEAEYLTARFDVSEKLYVELLERARSETDRAEVLFIQLEQLALQGRFRENLEIGRRALALLGVDLPEDEAAVEALFTEELARVEGCLGGRRIADLVHEPPLTGETQRQLMRILPNLAVAVFFLNRHDILQWSVVKRTNLALLHGHDELTSLAYVGYGVNVAAAYLNDYDTAWEFGQVAMEMAERYHHVAARGRVRMLFAVGIQHWRRHLTEGRDYFRRCFDDCVEGGDFSYAGYGLGIGWTYALIYGHPLDDLAAEIEERLPFLERTCGAFLDGAIRPTVIRQLACLRGETASTNTFDGTDADGFSEEAFLASAGQVPYFLALFNLARMRCLYLFGHVEKALPLVAEAEPWVERTMPGQANVPEFCFYAALILAASWDGAAKNGATQAERAVLAERLDDFCRRLAAFARQCGDNYAHKHLLVSAEQARIRGDAQQAMELCTRAVKAAQRNCSLANEALANELQARLWTERGESEVAGIYLLRARALYSQWGASAKVAQINRRHPELASRDAGLSDRSGTVTRVLNLDLATVVKASQAISSELRLDELLDKITAILVENAGAEGGCLILERGPQTRSACAGALANGIEPVQAVLDYVRRTGEEVVLGNASEDERFQADPRVASGAVGSVLCIPVRRKTRSPRGDQGGKAQGVLYLENNLVSNAFTAQRLEVLRLLLAQAAISLENAFLYDELKAHARELEAKNTELERFTYTVSHDLKSPLVTIQGFLGLLKKDIEKGEADAVEHDFRSISDAARTMAKLLHDLLEMSRTVHDLGTVSRVPLGPLIGEVVERVRRRLAESGRELPSIEVAGALPAVNGDRLRLAEVFQNLLDNAIRFTRGVDAPHIEVGCREEEDGGEVVFVRDNGAGIEKRYHEKVFNLFEQLNHGSEGTGIGLALTRRIVEMHGGRIWVESEGSGRGSTFCIAFAATAGSR